MKTILTAVIIILISTNIFSQQNNVAGIWTGKLDLPNSMKLSIVFNISIDDSGNYTSTLDSPDQGAMGIQTGSTKVIGDSILITVPVIKGSFAGRLFSETDKIEGMWSQGGLNLELILNKVDKVETPKRPQEPKEPFPYRTEEVTFKNIIDDVVLAGTLTLPREGNDFPAVVLISGSGGQNRDEELLGHKPFLVLADYLTRNGIAVLRFDDRGIAKSTGDFSKATSEDFAKDVIAAVKYLKSRDEINSLEIGLIGHSEGGLIAPMVATQSDDIAFIILMAGTGIPGDSIIIMQTKLIQKAEGVSEVEIEKSIRIQREMFELIKSNTEDESLKKQLKAKFRSEYDTMSDEEKNQLGDPEVYMDTQLKTLTSPWFKYFIKYDPFPTLEKVKCPVLAINGENDLQVPPKENLSAIEAALKKGGNTNYEIKMLPGLNHLFQTSTTGAISEYGKIEETISPVALQKMLDWVNKIITNLK